MFLFGLRNEEHAGHVARVVWALPRAASLEAREFCGQELELCRCSVLHCDTMAERAWAYAVLEFQADDMADPLHDLAARADALPLPSFAPPVMPHEGR
jgi:hypothetical protein